MLMAFLMLHGESPESIQSRLESKGREPDPPQALDMYQAAVSYRSYGV